MNAGHVFLFLFLSSLVISIFLNYLAKYCYRKKRMPPGPWCLPILGNLHALNPNKPHHSLLSLSNKHGPLMVLRLGSIPTLVISSRNIAEEIFTNYDLTFSDRPQLTAAKKLFYNCTSISFVPHNDQWRQARKIAVLELLSPSRVRSFEAVRREEVEKLITAIKHLSVVNMSELILSLTNNVICRAVLGHEFGDGKYGENGGKCLNHLLSEALNLFGSFSVADFFPRMQWVDRLRGFHGRLERNFEEMDKYFDGVIQEHLKKRENKEKSCDCSNGNDEEEKDFVDVLLRIHKNAVLHGGFLSSIDQVKSILLEIFLGGTETSATVITWTMTQLMRNPRVMTKLQEELKQITDGNTHGSLIQESQVVEKLEYLKQVIKESLRLKPPVTLILRRTNQPCEIQGYIVPADTRVILNAYAISMDPNVWERPEEFWPERFDGRKVDFKGRYFEFLPFGSGRRKCPGITFAMPIIEFTLANLFHCFDWSLPDGMKVEDISMEETTGITVHKKEALRLVAKPKW